MPRLQVHTTNEDEWNAEDYQNELALLQDRLAIYEREREPLPVSRRHNNNNSNCQLPVSSRVLEARHNKPELAPPRMYKQCPCPHPCNHSRYTILQQRHTQSEELVKGGKTEYTEKSKIVKNSKKPKIVAGISEGNPKREKHDLSIPVHLETLTTTQWVSMKVLIDSGCTNCLIDLEWVKSIRLEPAPLQKLIIMVNVDGSQN